MDILEDFYPLYQDYHETREPKNVHSDSSETESVYEISTKKGFLSSRAADNYDHWCCKHDDDIWYFWCMCKEHTTFNCLPFMDSMSYADFSMMCYKNSMSKLK